MLSLFNYKYVVNYHKNISAYYNIDGVRKYELEQYDNLQTIDYDGNSIVTRKYKNAGITNSTFIPRLIIGVGFSF